MNNTMMKRDINASSPPEGAARLVAMTSTGVNNHAIAANLSIALGKREKHVCLITTDCPSGNNPSLPGQNLESPLEDLLSGRKDLAETLLEGSPGTQILPVGSTFTNFPRMNGTQQRGLVELLIQLETAFDYLIVETAAEADGGLLELYQAAHFLLLIVTPEADSLTSAFSLLRAFKREHEDQPVHIIVDMAANLPNAHDIYKKLSRAAAKYLQMEAHYLGYFRSRQPLQGSVESRLAAANLYPDSLSVHQFEAIADRFCAIAETIVPSTSLSRHFSALCSAQITAGERIESASPAETETAETTETLTLKTAHDPGAWQAGSSDRISLYDAVHYAGMLAKREAQQ